MANMRMIMPSLQKARPAKLAAEGVTFARVALPSQRRETRIIKDMSADDIARDIVEWMGE
jgi:electron transfer flavoprotein beta subunit